MFLIFFSNTLGIRIVSSLLLVVASFVVTVILVVVDTSEIYLTFIWASLIVVVFMMGLFSFIQRQRQVCILLSFFQRESVSIKIQYGVSWHHFQCTMPTPLFLATILLAF